jgi:hypothetical protein
VATVVQEFRIAPGQTVRRSVTAACVDMALETPTASTTFAVDGIHSADMMTLLQRTPGFASAPWRVQQFAVWVVSDNPARYGFRELIGTGGSGPPTEAEINDMRALFERGGMNSSSYRALR